MNTKGIRISDTKEEKCVTLCEILRSIPKANEFKWALLWLDVIPIGGQGKFITELQKKVNHSIRGLPYSISSLIETFEKIFQEIDVLIIGSKTEENLHRYEIDQTMYETCDFVIEMIDGGFWEIFSKDSQWIKRLAKKYNRIELLLSNFQNNS